MKDCNFADIWYKYDEILCTYIYIYTCKYINMIIDVDVDGNYAATCTVIILQWINITYYTHSLSLSICVYIYIYWSIHALYNYTYTHPPLEMNICWTVQDENQGFGTILVANPPGFVNLGLTLYPPNVAGMYKMNGWWKTSSLGRVSGRVQELLLVLVCEVQSKEHLCFRHFFGLLLRVMELNLCKYIVYTSVHTRWCPIVS